MIDVMKMAGNHTSLALSIVFKGERLIPTMGFLKQDGGISRQVLMMDSADALSTGNHQLENLEEEHKGGVLIADAMVTLETGKTDALIIDVRFATDPFQKAQLCIPYRNAAHPKGFAVHRLKIMDLNGISNESMEPLANAFFEGLQENKEGSKIWDEHYVDQAGESSVYAEDEGLNFSGEDFEVLKQAPFLIFYLVATADGKIDKKELAKFFSVISDLSNYKSPLTHKVITNIINDISKMVIEISHKEMSYPAELAKLRVIIDDNLPAEEANKFKMDLVAMGKKIAEASGGFLGLGNKISKEEKTVLNAIAVFLGLKNERIN